MNRYFFTGNLVDTPTIAEKSGHKFAKFSVAVDVYKNDGSKKAQFVPVTTWDKQAEACMKHLVKGSKVLIEGAPSLSVVKIDGVSKLFFEVRGDRVEFLSPSRQSEGEGKRGMVDFDPAAVHPEDSDDIPY